MPNGCGVGGDAFWLIWDERNRRQLALNGSGRAAAAMDPSWVRGRGHSTMPMRGPLSITVPGALRSWADAHRRFGRLRVDQVLGPAIELARDGFPAWGGFIDAVEATSGIVAETVGPDAGWFEVCRPRGRAWRLGERVRQPALAATLERLAAAGFDDAYEGELGERQARFLAAIGSPIGLADLRTHLSTWTDPIGVDYRGVRVTTHPPNSSGLVALEVLNILERFEPPPQRGASAEDTAGWIHLGIEAAKLAMADRDACLTDPEFHAIPIDRLLDTAYAADLAASIDRDRASRPVASRQPRGGGTTYMAAVDREGLAVSLIASN